MDLAPLTPKQAATVRLAKESRIAIWEGAVRSGKTIVSLIAWADFLLQAPNGPLLMAGRTQDTLRRNVIDPLTDLLGTDNVKVTWGDGRGVILGKQIHLVGADNQSSESRIRGLTLAGAYVDELTIIGGPNGREWWQMLLTRMSVKGSRILATTNPGSPSHWLLENYLSKAELTITPEGTVERYEEAPQGLRVHRYRFTIDDNQTLPYEYVESIKASLSGLFYKRFIDGLWVAAEGAVYPMLDNASHVFPKAPELKSLRHLTVGIDHGSTNPTHAVLCGVDGEGVLWAVQELRLTDPLLTPEQQAARLWEWIQGIPVADDEDYDSLDEAEKRVAVERALMGLPISLIDDVNVVIDPAAKGFRNAWHHVTGRYPKAADNSVLPGITDVSSLLGQNRLRFVEGATPHLFRELSGYVWDPRAQERGIDQPLKKDDHGPDALRYAVRYLRVNRNA